MRNMCGKRGTFGDFKDEYGIWESWYIGCWMNGVEFENRVCISLSGNTGENREMIFASDYIFGGKESREVINGSLSSGQLQKALNGMNGWQDFKTMNETGKL